jgi:hypothetical protein
VAQAKIAPSALNLATIAPLVTVCGIVIFAGDW